MLLSQLKGIVHVSQLVIDIARERLTADHVATVGHIIDTPFQLADQSVLGMARET